MVVETPTSEETVPTEETVEPTVEVSEETPVEEPTQVTEPVVEPVQEEASADIDTTVTPKTADDFPELAYPESAIAADEANKAASL